MLYIYFIYLRAHTIVISFQSVKEKRRAGEGAPDYL